jgi:hypothetical protein
MQTLTNQAGSPNPRSPERMILVDQSLDIEHGPTQLPTISAHQPNAL